MRRTLVLALLVLGLSRGAAEALTVRDIMELSRAGLGDEVLLALIEVNRGVYAIDLETLKALKTADVSDRVIAALVRSGREAPPDPTPASGPAEEAVAPGQVVVIEHHAPAQIQEVAVPVPVYVPVPVVRSRHGRVAATPPAESTFVPFRWGPPVETPRREEPPGRPVYWGFGGKLRPDTWEPAGHRHKAAPRDPQGASDKSRRDASR